MFGCEMSMSSAGCCRALAVHLRLALQVPSAIANRKIDTRLAQLILELLPALAKKESTDTGVVRQVY